MSYVRSTGVPQVTDLFFITLSRRCRTVFRRVGGFVYLMSVLVGMEGSLATPAISPWSASDRLTIHALLHQTFATLATAMRYEPANAKFFYQEIAQASLAQALRMLGCFSPSSLSLLKLSKPPEQEVMDKLQSIFLADLPSTIIPASTVSPFLESACIVLRLLHDLAIDAFKPRLRSKASTPGSSSTPPPSLSTQTSMTEASTPTTPGTKKKPCALPLNQRRELEPVLVHSGAVLAVLQLLPNMAHPAHQVTANLMFHDHPPVPVAPGGEWSATVVHRRDNQVSVADRKEPADDVRREANGCRSLHLQAVSRG